MLDSIEIKNFRSCEDVQLRLGEHVVALLGKNGAGKTNVLHAVQLAAELCVGDSESIFSLHPRDPRKPTVFVLQFTIGSSRFVYRTSRSSINSKGEIFEELLEKDNTTLFRRTGEAAAAPLSGLPNGIRIGTGAATLPTLLQILPQADAASAELRPVAEYLRCIQYYPLLQGFQEHLVGPTERVSFNSSNFTTSPLIGMPHYEAWKTGLALGRPLCSIQMRLLHLYLTDESRFDELRSLLGENGLGLLADIRIEKIQLHNPPIVEKSEDSANHGFMITFMPGVSLAGSGRWFQYSGLSAGTWRILQLLTYLIFDKNSCMLLEQPEDSIHPGLLAKVLDILETYAGQTQLICTTHSPRVMNLIDPKGIRFVTATEGLTSVAEMSDNDLNEAKHYLEDEGTLAEFLETL